MNYFDVFPKIVRANQISQVVIRPRFDHSKFPDIEQLKISCNPFSGLDADNIYRNWNWKYNASQEVKAKMVDDALELHCFFAGEGEHTIIIEYQNPKNGNEIVKRLFSLYSLNEDLYELQPYKGDFHVHTHYSDGLEAPAYVAARYRQKGFDFVAITDHGQYFPSLEAIEYWKPYQLDFQLFPGEEVHSPNNEVHIVNFGGSFSVNEKYRKDEATYRKEVAEILEKMPDKRSDMEMFPVAASEWVFEQIRSGGGLGVFCHPYWYVLQNVLSEGTVSEMFKRRKFDALELLGGFHKHQMRSNNFQVVRCFEEQMRGSKFPVVGVSDSHGTDCFELNNAYASQTQDSDLFNWFYTIVFAKSDSLVDLIEGIKSSKAVAVTAPVGERHDIYGEFRLITYADFLMREYFPLQERYCEVEGLLMQETLAGESLATEVLQKIKHRVKELRKKCFTNEPINMDKL